MLRLLSIAICAFWVLGWVCASPAAARFDPPRCSPDEVLAHPFEARDHGLPVEPRASHRCRHLEGADFSGQTLEGTNFQYADLTGADFRGTVLIDVDFRHARLGDAEFRGATIDGGEFCGAHLIRARDLMFLKVVGEAPDYCSKTTLDRAVFDPDLRGWSYENFYQARWAPWTFITPADIKVDARYIPTLYAGDGSLKTIDFGITLVGVRFSPLAYRRDRGDYELMSGWHENWIPDMGLLFDVGIAGFRNEPVIAFSAGAFVRPISIVSVEAGFIYAGPVGDLWDVPETDRGVFISLRLNSGDLGQFGRDVGRAIFGPPKVAAIRPPSRGSDSR